MQLFQGLCIKVLEVGNQPQSLDLLSFPIIVIVFLGKFLKAILDFREECYELLERFQREHANCAVVFCTNRCSARSAIQQGNFTKNRAWPNLLNKIFIFTKLSSNYQYVCQTLLEDKQMCARLSLSYDVLIGLELSSLNIIKNEVINFGHPSENWMVLHRFQEEVFLDLGFQAHWQFCKKLINIFPLEITVVSFI